MIDIETTEIGPEGLNLNIIEVLEIALLEMEMTAEGTYRTGKYMTLFLPSLAKPGPWALMNGQERIYEEANKLWKDLSPLEQALWRDLGPRGAAVRESSERARQSILGWLKDSCGLERRWDIHFVGRNAGQFDLRILPHLGILRETDYHYRVYDVGSAAQLAADVLGLPVKAANELVDLVKEPVSCDVAGGPHTALWDCHDQVRRLNAFIEILRNPGDYRDRIRMLDDQAGGG